MTELMEHASSLQDRIDQQKQRQDVAERVEWHRLDANEHDHEHDPSDVATEREFHSAESKCGVQHAGKAGQAIESVDDRAGAIASGRSRAIWWTRVVVKN